MSDSRQLPVISTTRLAAPAGRCPHCPPAATRPACRCRCRRRCRSARSTWLAAGPPRRAGRPMAHRPRRPPTLPARARRSGAPAALVLQRDAVLGVAAGHERGLQQHGHDDLLARLHAPQAGPHPPDSLLTSPWLTLAPCTVHRPGTRPPAASSPNPGRHRCAPPAPAASRCPPVRRWLRSGTASTSRGCGAAGVSVGVAVAVVVAVGLGVAVRLVVAGTGSGRCGVVVAVTRVGGVSSSVGVALGVAVDGAAVAVAVGVILGVGVAGPLSAWG